MADTTIAKLQNSTSHTALSTTLGHQLNILGDGLTVGIHGIIASVAGTPVDLYYWAKERATGFKSSTPPEERLMSSDWLKQRADKNFTQSQKMLGHERPELREGTTDTLLHTVYQFGPVFASFFVPGVGQARLTETFAKYGQTTELVGKVAGNLGFQLNALDLTTMGISGVEILAEVDRPIERSKTIPIIPSSVAKFDM